MNLPNTITLTRIALIPLFIIAVPQTGEYGLLPPVLFILAGVTDGLDGAIARKYKQVTTFGKFLDPLADKLLVTAALLVFLSRGQMSDWAVMIVLAREFVITSLRIVAIDKGVVIAAKPSGKVKTFTQIVCIVFMMTGFRHQSLLGVSLNDCAVWLILLVTVWSGIDYVWGGRKLFTEARILK